MSNTPVTWDLTDLFAGVTDPKIDSALAEVDVRVASFAVSCAGRVGQLSPAEFAVALGEYEGIQRTLAFPAAYSELLFSGDTSNPAHGALMQRMQERSVAAAQQLLFFELELVELSEEKFAELLSDTGTAAYRHYLEHERAARPHRLSEAEERILMEKSVTSGQAFSRLFDETIAAMTFTMTLNGETVELSESEILNKSYDPDRAVRKAAAEGISAALSKNEKFFTYVTNVLAYDKSVNDRLTHFNHAEESRHLSDEVDTDTVHTMINSVVEHYDTVARYYKLKREIMGLDKLYHYDRYAPILSDTATISWDDSVKIVRDSYTAFAPEMGEMVDRFINEKWVDAEPRHGKRSGAFCAGLAPDWHPYVLMNFLGKKRDVMTLAHELGHGIHDLYAGGQKFLQYYPSLAAAETASVFGEMLTFNELLAEEHEPMAELALLTGKIEDVFATVFRQTAMYRFEQGVHTERRAKGELTPAQVNEIWQTNLQEMFGDSVELGEGHACFWMYIPHFIHTPFYVYAYAFGQLMVMALYARYKKEGASFVPHYQDILRAGGSARPADIMAKAGIDINDPTFWDDGLQMIDELVTKAEEVWAQTKR